jgi:tetratricopeptide (TPR) repeat protein
MSGISHTKSDPSQKEASILRAIQHMKSNRPLRAEEACRDYLLRHPGCADHLRLLGHALMKQQRLTEAEEQLRLALSLQPDFPQLHEDLGSVLAMQSRFDEAIPAFEKAIALQPALPLAQRKLGQALAAVGRGEEADKAFSDYLDKDDDRADVISAAELQQAGHIDEAREKFRQVLMRSPNNVNAMRYLALIYWQNDGQLADAEALLRGATQAAPDFTAAWLTQGALLLEMNKHMESIAAYLKATELEPDNAEAWAGLGNAYGRSMYPEKAVEAFARAIAISPSKAGIQMSYAHELKTVGDQAGALLAYRAAIQNRPRFGQVYWSMANLKVFEFEEAEVKAMLGQLERDDLTETEDIHFRFALGKAMEDRKDYDQAWHFYHSGNERQRMTVTHEPLEMESRHSSVKEVFSKELIASRSNEGYDVPDPIFIVGLPRSGSTLVEQILASHSQVEGTSELPILGKIAESIGRYRVDGMHFPEAITELRSKDLRAYGKQYIEESRRHRLTDKPFFTDKLPNNFPLVGFIHLILPNAKVINARRHPFDSCLGAYKQLFGRGQNFTYDMLDLAHYYQQYDAMMKHWHQVLPGKVLDVHYEETVTNLEWQVRRILAHCGLPFEESCLRYHETERAVKTASSEQVRLPIYTAALGRWRRYEKHLGIWQQQLGYIIDELPQASRNAGL